KKYYRNTKTNGDIGGLPAWRVDNLYTLIASIVTMTITVSGFYFAMANRLNILEQKQNYTNAQLNEISSMLKERRAFNDDTRARVITLETKMDNVVNNR
ncbi:MAG: hypothetical protein NUV44_10840, partial [Candidatus Scalindua sp.]|nr:hypothetical protein [Candidatus Scalindua sp.]